jgi:hypothetical protein
MLTQSIEFILLHFLPCFFLLLFIFLQIDFFAAVITSKVVVIYAPSSSRCHLAEGGSPHRSPAVPLTVIGLDKIG